MMVITPKHVGAVSMQILILLLKSMCISCCKTLILINEMTLLKIKPLNAKLYPICHLLTLLAHHVPHVSRIRVKSDSLLLISAYVYF